MLHLLHYSTAALLPATLYVLVYMIIICHHIRQLAFTILQLSLGNSTILVWLHHTCSAWAWHNDFVLLSYWFIYFLFLKSAFWQPFQYCWDLFFLLHSILCLSIFQMLLLLDPSLKLLSRRCRNLNHIHVLAADLNAVEKRQNRLRWMASI